ncbi:hypothetical protein MTR67_039546 [Solanum verrucosum]|uniref:Tf2-1-like SH3-like domain-containing protein n=1 Tax=Solanum verrucosum TaxID=315347 RepID=A0AAF0UIC3_SOLVR|nr:hypothetical protein MTR67_039546 [Solanum verrucosum]
MRCPSLSSPTMTEGQSERTIQVLEHMLRACVIDFGGHWDKFLPLLKDAQDKVKSIQAKLLAAQSRQKKYAGHKIRDMTFQTGENALLKVSPMIGVMRFGKKYKLSPQYIGPFKVLECVGPVAYISALPPSLSGVHPVFHVSMLKRYHCDGDYIIKWDSIVLDKDL